MQDVICKTSYLLAMTGFTSQNRSPPPQRERVSVTCSSCKVETTVPFTPTPGRPVYCRDCFAKQNANAPPGRPGAPRPGPGGPRRGAGGGRFGPARASDINRSAPKKHMLAQGRKAHFVYDVLEALENSGLETEQRRVFVEMLFTRGSRQSSEAAFEFLVEKHGDKQVTDDEANQIEFLLKKYSFRR